MSRLPKASLAIVEKHKITEYLLSASHPYGRAKTAFFQSRGFQIDAWQELQAALLKHAQENAATSSAETPFGKKYIIDGPLSTKGGRNPIVRTIWFIEAGEEQPRFVTAYPLKGKEIMIQELELVVLTQDLPEEGLQVGDIGTVVLLHQGGAGCEVEFATLSGETLVVVTVPANAIRPVGKREIAHVREVA